MNNYFIEITGFVRSIETFGEDWLISIWDGKDEEHITNLIVNKYTVLTNMLGENMELSNKYTGNYLCGFVNGRKPVLAIYPPRFYPELVAIREQNQIGRVSVGLFDENLKSEKLSLKLNILRDTKIEDCFGRSLQRHQIENRYLFVYYARTTRSIPAQAPVSKIIAYIDPFGKMQDSV